MDVFGGWWEHVEHFVAVRDVKDSTRYQYRLVLDRYLRWLVNQNLLPGDATPATISKYLNQLKIDGRAHSTTTAHFQVLRSFYRWLQVEKIIDTDPTSKMGVRRNNLHLQDTVSVEELSALWHAADDPFDRLIVGLLGINSLRTEEVTLARMEDLGTREGHQILQLPNRRGMHRLTYTVLPREVRSTVIEHAGSRRSGPLLLRKGRPPSRAAQAWTLARLSKKAGVESRVTPNSLTMAMRVIAIERGFSYVGVVRSAGDMETRRLSKWVERSPSSLNDHAALRLARLVVGSGDESTDHFMNARVLLRESDTPPSIAAQYAGATLERHLRALVVERGFEVTTTNPKLGSYSSILSARGVISPSEVQLIARIQKYRDLAAHGWFDDVNEEEANWTIRESEYLTQKFPLAENR